MWDDKEGLADTTLGGVVLHLHPVTLCVCLFGVREYYMEVEDMLLIGYKPGSSTLLIKDNRRKKSNKRAKVGQNLPYLKVDKHSGGVVHLYFPLQLCCV